MQPLNSASESDQALPPNPDDAVGSAVETEVALYYVFIEEVLQGGAVSRADRFLAAEFVEHGARGDRHRHDFVAHLAERRARFPNAVWTIESLAGVGGLVVCYMTVVTPELPLQGWESVVIRFSAGKIAECWTICDSSLLLS
jgi:predicted SnoaL-like aldol condensation-catalyzing enzyme